MKILFTILVLNLIILNNCLSATITCYNNDNTIYRASADDIYYRDDFVYFVDSNTKESVFLDDTDCIIAFQKEELTN